MSTKLSININCRKWKLNLLSIHLIRKEDLKKTLIILFLTLGFISVSYSFVSAKEISEETELQKAKTEKYISWVYNKIKFPKGGKLNYEVFKNAFYGYLNLSEAGKVDRENILSICDFTLSSNKKRLWIIDLKNKKVLHHSLVAHGMGTGEEYATVFSNTHDSHQSSLGFYITKETYTGNNGYSLKLEGVDGSYNSNAYDRAIVIHGAEYVSEQFARDNQRLGRSHGCPALPVETAPVIIDKLKNGTCFFIYHTANNYLSKSRWLNNSVQSLPMEAEMMDLNEVANNPRYVKSAIKPLELSDDEAKPDVSDAPKEKKISSVVIINLNSRTGQSDTCVVK